MTQLEIDDAVDDLKRKKLETAIDDQWLEFYERWFAAGMADAFYAWIVTGRKGRQPPS